MRAIGGTIYLVGNIIMVYNLVKTVKAGSFIGDEATEAPALDKAHGAHKGEYWHRWIERRPVQMLVFSAVAILIGGIIEIFPMVMIDSNVPKIESVKPYTPLELAGRDIYIREGCLGCHSQMVRPFRSETERYGEYSKSGEFIYDRPFLWGSKRTGPDLHREGGKYPDSWHFNHMLEPQSISPGSIMPAYPWLIRDELDLTTLPKRISVLRTLGTPYPEGYEDLVFSEAEKQAKQIAGRLKTDGIEMEDLEKKEIIAMIAYLQRLGTDIKPKK